MENKPIKEEKLLDLISNEREKWVMKSEYHFHSNEKKLELRLGLPGVEEDEEESKPKKKEGYNGNYGQIPLSMGFYDKKNKNFPSCSAIADVPNRSHKRAAPVAVVGWPPVRSHRKNLASGSSAKTIPKPPIAPPIKSHENATEKSYKGLFVKINMEGVAIGRKVDLNAYDNYDKLSSVVDTLFRVLRAAQMDSSLRGEIKHEREKPIAGLLDGSGEYTLVYEDNEGDRMLVGDVPWNMFVSTVKRLRVLKSSQLPSLRKFGDKEWSSKGE